jgi:hypothetical protein
VAKWIEMELGGTVFHARLLEERAPKTTQAIWDALPFGGRAVHAQLSGEMFRMYEHTPVDLDQTEPGTGTGFQYPGELVYYAPIKEIAICYGDARFRGAAAAVPVTPLAEIVPAELAGLAEVAPKLQFEGATPIAFRQGSEPAVKDAQLKGRKIEVRVGDVSATATLLEDKAPRTVEEIVKRLPIQGQVTNTTWSGGVSRLWGDGPPPMRGIGLRMENPEALTRFHWPGYVYYFPDYEGIRIVYGDGQMSGAFSSSGMTPLAKFDGDWSTSEMRKTLANLFLEGAKPISLGLLG